MKPFSYVLAETLRPGCKNPEVWLLQAMLTSISNHFVNLIPPSINGIYDTHTTESIKRIQRSCGLPTTGETNQDTWDHIIMMFCYWR